MVADAAAVEFEEAAAFEEVEGGGGGFAGGADEGSEFSLGEGDLVEFGGSDGGLAFAADGGEIVEDAEEAFFDALFLEHLEALGLAGAELIDEFGEFAPDFGVAVGGVGEDGAGDEPEGAGGEHEGVGAVGVSAEKSFFSNEFAGLADAEDGLIEAFKAAFAFDDAGLDEVDEISGIAGGIEGAQGAMVVVLPDPGLSEDLGLNEVDEALGRSLGHLVYSSQSERRKRCGGLPHWAAVPGLGMSKRGPLAGLTEKFEAA